MALTHVQQCAAVVVVGAQAITLGDAAQTYGSGAVTLLLLTRSELWPSWAIAGALALAVTVPHTIVFHTVAAAAVAAHVVCVIFGEHARRARTERRHKGLETRPTHTAADSHTTTRFTL